MFEFLVWLSILIVFLAIEIVRVKTFYIFISISAFFAMLAYALGAGLLWQFLIFTISCSFLLLIIRTRIEKITSQKKRKETIDTAIETQKTTKVDS